MNARRGGVHVALSGWFAGRPVGSGTYVDHLVRALEAAYPADSYALVVPRWRNKVLKVPFEQWGFPRRAARCDVAHVPYWAPPWKSSAPVVVTIHDLVPLRIGAYRGGPARRAYFALVARSSRRAPAVIVDSRHTAREVAAELGVEPAAIHVVPLGVEQAPGEAAPPDPGWPVEPLPPRFGLYLGGYDPRKNVSFLLEVWRAIHSEFGLPLVLAGQGAPSEPPVAVGVGVVPEAAKRWLYSRAELFVYPSAYEGFGLPPLEAMAAGLPVVAADSTSLPEVVGGAGLLVDPTDHRGWVEAISGVLRSPGLAAELGALGRQRAAAFSWEATARATRGVYARLAGRRRARR